MTSVCAVGLAVVDLVFEVGAVPSPGEKQFASGGRLVGGGPAANAAATVARLGGRAIFVGRVGDDPMGAIIREGLTEGGVDTAIETIAGATSPVSAVLVTTDGERTIVNRTDPALHTTGPQALPQAGAYLADIRWPLGADAAAVAARSHGVPCVLDLDRTDGAVPEAALRSASHVIASRSALGITDPETTLRALAHRTDAWVAVTLGADGVMWADDGVVRQIRPPRVEVVDTLAAGDVFHGAFALALAEGRDEASALRFSSAAAAAKCELPGGRAGIPERQRVEELEATTWT